MPWAVCIRREGDTSTRVMHVFEAERGALSYLDRQVLEYQANGYQVDLVANEPHTFLISEPQREGKAAHHLWLEYLPDADERQ